MKRATLDAQLDFALPEPPKTKLCTGCGANHPLSKFLPTKFTDDGLTDNCLTAIRARSEQERLAREKRFAEAREKAPGSKTCKCCKRSKPIGQFSRHRLSKDGHVHRCKACTAAAKEKPKGRTPEQSQREREQAAEPHRRVANRIAVQSWSERHPEAVAARRRLRQAVAKGHVTPAPCCQERDCSERKLDAHHANYSRELEVLWLCRQHHRQIHSGFRLVLKDGVDKRLARVPRSKKREKR